MKSHLFCSKIDSSESPTTNRVTVSPWVNEQSLPWNEILSAHDVARLTRAPAELQAIEERIQRLRARLQIGDPDLTPDELEGALAKAEEKRRSLLCAPSVAGVSRAIAMLPSAAEEFRQQIKEGLAGDVTASLRARVALRQLFGGQIKMLPEQDGSLYAEYQQQRIALLQGVGTNGGPCSHQIQRTSN